jgi:hypothetical protein
MASILRMLSTPTAWYSSPFLGQNVSFAWAVPSAVRALYYGSSALDARLVMKGKHTRSTREPSRASLREMPEVDFSSARVLGRGRHVERARRSFETLVVDKQVLKVLGGQDAVIGILEVLAKSIAAGRRKRRAA